MNLLIAVKVKGDIPEDTAYDCEAAVEDTLREAGLEVEDINFHFQRGRGSGKGGEGAEGESELVVKDCLKS